MLKEAEVKPTKVPLTNIYAPLNISEQSKVSGFAFSKRVSKKIPASMQENYRRTFEGTTAFENLTLANKMESDSAGGATLSANSIKIWVSATHPIGGSTAKYIWLNFGPEKRLKLHGESNGFPKGAVFTWDLNSVGDWLEDNITTDLWDDIGLVNDSPDGIKIDRIEIMHSGERILDWDSNIFLDGGIYDEYTKVVLSAKILETKLNQINNLWVPQIHYAAREIGKTDGRKYGTGGKWCSEFASWCIKKAMWNTPHGSIDSQSMENYFRSIGRKQTHDDLLSRKYRLVQRDYLRFQWTSGGFHSGIFIEYIDDPAIPGEGTTIRTIEGNAGGKVTITTRTYQNIFSVGNCQ